MSPEKAELLRRWHEESDASLRTMDPADVVFMGLQLDVTQNVYPVDESADGDPYHQAVPNEVRPGMRGLGYGHRLRREDTVGYPRRWRGFADFWWR